MSAFPRLGSLLRYARLRSIAPASLACAALFQPNTALAQEPTLAPAAVADCVADDAVTVERDGDKVVVKIDGDLVTEYLERSGAKPVLWPVLGPSGHELTRAYPQRETAGPHEREDHVHHRSFWFTHGDVNGISFWHETEGHGNILHREFTELTSGDVGVIESLNDWMSPEGVKQCEDLRRFEFSDHQLGRLIKVSIIVTATEGPLRFGDTKEGSFGVRVAGSMKVDEKLGGTILTSEGLRDGESWGKPASWVDYAGPVGEGRGGITILNHPSSYGYPSHWHVRTYGLFAANPFGLHDFYGADSGRNGALELELGESFTLSYLVLLHDGDVTADQINELFKTYSDEAPGR